MEKGRISIKELKGFMHQITFNALDFSQWQSHYSKYTGKQVQALSLFYFLLVLTDYVPLPIRLTLINNLSADQVEKRTGYKKNSLSVLKYRFGEKLYADLRGNFLVDITDEKKVSDHYLPVISNLYALYRDVGLNQTLIDEVEQYVKIDLLKDRAGTVDDDQYREFLKRYHLLVKADFMRDFVNDKQLRGLLGYTKYLIATPEANLGHHDWEMRKLISEVWKI